MLTVTEVTLGYSTRVLFKDVNINFTPGNCYGLIGANGSGKSTLLKILAGEIQPDQGKISKNPRERIAVLKQDQFAFDAYTVQETVIMGYEKLYQVLKEREIIYAKADFSEADGHRAAELEELVANMNGYEAEANAAILLNGLGITTAQMSLKMSELAGGDKVRVLLAQALFGNPDILLLDEPTNNLDIESIGWLENFLYNFSNTVIVVSHDRHFINKICTHIADIDFGKIQLYTGNYDFWVQVSQLAAKQKNDAGKKREDRTKELKAFIERFSSNASKARQATARKKELERLTIDELPATSRRFPYIAFKPSRECGDIILNVAEISKKSEGMKVLDKFSLSVNKGDKIAFFSQHHLVKSTLFNIIAGVESPDAGTFKWGETITFSYFPQENSEFFASDLNLIDWLRQYSSEKDESYIRGFLGRMLFSGDETLKKVGVLSGGEKVRCMLSRMMLSGANTLIFDEPTNHLDLEGITALNNSLISYTEAILFTSHDHQFISSVANRIIEITPSGAIDRAMSFDEYLDDGRVRELRDEFYHGHERLIL